jgi:hypothetical protein
VLQNGLLAMKERTKKMELKDALDAIRTKPVVPLWPHVGLLLDLSRGAVYASVRRDEIDVIRVGRSIKAVTAPLRKRLGLDDPE